MKALFGAVFLFFSAVSYAGAQCGQTLSCKVYDQRGLVGQNATPIVAVNYPGDDRDSRFGPYSLCEGHLQMQLGVNLGDQKNPDFPYGVKVDVVEDSYNYEFFFCGDESYRSGAGHSDEGCVNKQASYKGGFLFVDALAPIKIFPYTQYVVDCRLNNN